MHPYHFRKQNDSLALSEVKPFTRKQWGGVDDGSVMCEATSAAGGQGGVRQERKPIAAVRGLYT